MDELVEAHSEKKADFNVAFWLDDDIRFLHAIQEKIERHAIRVEITQTKYLIDAFELSTKYREPAVLLTEIEQVSDIEYVANFFETHSVNVVISDLEMGNNHLAGLTLLATVGKNNPNCYRALVSGNINNVTADLCRSMGINDIFPKDNIERVINKVVSLFGGKRDLDELKKEYNNLLINYKTVTREADILDYENKELKKERNKLRRMLRELRDQKSPNKKAHDRESNTKKNHIEKRAVLAEQRVQIVLGHQHDLQSIASAVTTTLGNLCAQPELLPPTIKEKLEGAWTAARQTSVLIASTLDIATDEKPSKQITGSIPQAFIEAQRIIADQMSDRISLNILLPEEMRVSKIPDNMLVRCALNLFNNAKDGIVGRGRIEVTTKTKSSSRAKHVEVVIQDNGKGIKKRDLPRVFDWGFTTKGKRYGMGLFIVRKIMERYDGQVKIESVRGKGTSVTLRIPVG